MEDTEKIITQTLQKGLSGHLKLDSSLNPRNIASSILKNVDFSKRYSEFEGKKVNDYKLVVLKNLKEIEEDMNSEYEKLGDEDSDKMLKNFIRGQITAIEKIKNKLE